MKNKLNVGVETFTTNDEIEIRKAINEPLLEKVTGADVETFTTNSGIEVRRAINYPLRQIFKLAAKRKIIVDEYPKLEKKVPYIFASSHSFDEDIIAALATIDRSAYALIGTTNQIEHNPQMYAAWLNGMIYVNRMDAKSRKDSIKKMERIINSGSSILIFPEGGWNNTENLLCQPLFAGPYILSQLTGAKVVPLSSFNEHNSENIYIKVSEPLDFSNLSKEDALLMLRDSLATMTYKHMEEHTSLVKRSDLSENCRLEFMEERLQEYMRVEWDRDVWDEELTVYKRKDVVSPQEVLTSLKNVKLTAKNAAIIGLLQARQEIEEQYDFKVYMKKNWNRKCG